MNNAFPYVASEVEIHTARLDLDQNAIATEKLTATVNHINQVLSVLWDEDLTAIQPSNVFRTEVN